MGLPTVLGCTYPVIYPNLLFGDFSLSHCKIFFLEMELFFPQKDVEIALRQIKWISVVKGEGVNGD